MVFTSVNGGTSFMFWWSKRAHTSALGQERKPGPTGKGEANHYKVYTDAIRNPDPRAFNKSIEEGFYSCALIHLANISYRLGRSLNFDPAAMRFVNDPQADAMLTREYRKPFVVPDKV